MHRIVCACPNSNHAAMEFMTGFACPHQFILFLNLAQSDVFGSKTIFDKPMDRIDRFTARTNFTT